MGFVITDETPYVDPHSRGTGSIVTQRKGYILRTRGEHNRLVRHNFECPVHGVFEARVPSGEVPQDMFCGHAIDSYGPRIHYCGLASPYCVPTVAQGLAAGTVKT